VGSDHGQGAWLSWLKIFTMSGNEVLGKMTNDASLDSKTAYFAYMVAGIT